MSTRYDTAQRGLPLKELYSHSTDIYCQPIMFQAQRIRCLPFRSLQSSVTFLQNIRYWDANWELIMEEFERLGYKRSTTCIHHTDALKASPVEFSISYVS